MIAMGSPTQKMCMTMPMAIILKENGNFTAAESGTTTRFMKKCKCSKIMSPLNGNETLSPCKDGDDESERVPTGESD
jgi:hypothetical protein